MTITTHTRNSISLICLRRFVFVLTLVLAAALLATQLAQAQTYSILLSFKPGRLPYSGVILDGANNLYGTTVRSGLDNAGMVYKLTTADRRKVLYSFTGPTGANPYAGVIRDAKGNLYGTTFSGGANGRGSVFKLTVGSNGAWAETMLYSFAGPDGANPIAGVIRDAAGNLYGTTNLGGASGNGALFKLTPNQDGTSTESLLYSFCALTNCNDGSRPNAGVIRDGAGNLYGATSEGGSAKACDFGCGTVFKLDASGKYRVLYTFTGGADGARPNNGVIRDKSGNLYGTANGGGDQSCENGCGVVFKLDQTGKQSVLHSFTAHGDGEYPNAGLIMDAAGNLYGTTLAGGASGSGTVFKLDTSGVESVLYNFCSQVNCADGDVPAAGVVQDANGDLYGTTELGGVYGGGVVFRITP